MLNQTFKQINDGTTPLFAASTIGNTEIVDLLLTYKANPELQADDGVTPLFIGRQGYC